MKHLLLNQDVVVAALAMYHLRGGKFTGTKLIHSII